MKRVDLLQEKLNNLLEWNIHRVRYVEARPVGLVGKLWPYT